MPTDTARRVLSAAQLAAGLATLAAPRALVRPLTPRGAVPPDPRIVRVLGARQVAQGAVGLVRPSVEVITIGVVVDALHALSLVPVLALSRRYRPAALVSTGLAGAAAAWGVRLAQD